MAERKVKSYQRVTKSGKVVTVKEYSREGNTEAATTARVLPGRPPLAAKAGNFANGRSIPNVWVTAAKKSPESPEGVAEELKKEFLSDKASGDKEAESVAKDLVKEFLSPKSQKVIQAAAQILDENTVNL